MGLIVGLSGTDGSGKTTVAKLTVEKLQASGLKAMYHHEFDYLILKPLLRLLAKLGGDKRTEAIKERVLLKTETGQPLYSDVYYILIWLDNLASYLYFKLKKGIIIHDRWLYDFFTFFDHKYYKNRLVKKLFALFPRPNILILLVVSPETAYLRKRGDASHVEHDVQYYQNMQLKALENSRRWNCDGIIDSNKPINEVVDDVLAVVRRNHHYVKRYR